MNLCIGRFWPSSRGLVPGTAARGRWESETELHFAAYWDLCDASIIGLLVGLVMSFNLNAILLL